MNLTRLAFITLLFGLLVACDTAGGLPNPPRDDNPGLERLIREVSVSPATITLGETATISWEVNDPSVTVAISPAHVAFSDAGWAIVEPVEAGGVEYTLTAELNGYDPESHPVTLTVLDPDDSLPVPPGPGEGPHSLSGTIFTLDGALLTDASDLIAEVDTLSNGAGARDPLRQHMYGVFEAGAASTWLLPHDDATVTVAYIGRAVRTQHEDFGAALLPGYDFCANWDCTETDTDIDTLDEPEEAAPMSAVGTAEIGVLAAASNNGKGGMNFAGPHEGVIEVLPLKAWHQRLTPAGDAVDLNSHPDAFLNALAYALGEDPGVDGLAAREPVDIVYFDYFYYNWDLKHDLDPAQEARLRSLLDKAVAEQVLIIMPSYFFEDAVAGDANPFGAIARDEYREIFLGVFVESCVPDLPCEPDANSDVATPASNLGPSDQPHEELGYYDSSSSITNAVGIAALLQHHTGLRGSALRDAIRNDAACAASACPDAPSPRLDLALGLPGPGATILLELKDQHGRLIRHQEVELGYAGFVPYEFNLDTVGTFTLEATTSGATFTLHRSMESEVGYGHQTLSLLLQPDL